MKPPNKTWAYIAVLIIIATPFIAIRCYGARDEGLIVGLPVSFVMFLVLIARKERKLRTGIIGLAVLFCLMIMMTSGPQPAYLAERRILCKNHLKIIGEALQQYHDEHGAFPPPYLIDAEGNPTRSWRSVVLAYVKKQEPDIEGDELFGCPELKARKFPFRGYQETSIAPKTAYVAILGDQTAWQAGGVRHAQIVDGISNTILVIEIRNSTIEWNEPRDLSVDQLVMGLGSESSDTLGSPHIGSAALMADGSVVYLPPNVAPGELRSLLTIDGGEVIDSDKWRW